MTAVNLMTGSGTDDAAVSRQTVRKMPVTCSATPGRPASAYVKHGQCPYACSNGGSAYGEAPERPVSRQGICCEGTSRAGIGSALAWRCGSRGWVPSMDGQGDPPPPSFFREIPTDQRHHGSVRSLFLALKTPTAFQRHTLFRTSNLFHVEKHVLTCGFTL